MDYFQRKLSSLATDYADTVGKPFTHFFCPFLHTDEPAALCKAHIVNQAFSKSSRKWTVQRADVDNFFGRVFEGKFTSITADFAAARYLSKQPGTAATRPQLYAAEKEILYYFPKGPIPSNHSLGAVVTEYGPVPLVLKLHQDELKIIGIGNLQFVTERDFRIEALVSLLKMAYLALFEMVGYRYALSAGGMLLGHDILGKFYRDNHEITSIEVVRENAFRHFVPYAGLVRPIITSENESYDTVEERILYICEEPDRWGLIVILRTDSLRHAVFVPILDTPHHAAKFLAFLKQDGATLRARKCYFDGDSYQVANQVEQLVWPPANFARPEDPY